MPDIISKKEITVIGVLLNTSFKNGRFQKEIPSFFHMVYKEKKLKNVPNKKNNNQLCIFRIKKDSPDFDYIMGVEVKNYNVIPAGMECITLPASKYVEMEIIKKGYDDVGAAFKYLYEEWIPANNYEQGDSCGFIYYDKRFFSVYDRYGYEGNPKAVVYVPLK